MHTDYTSRSSIKSADHCLKRQQLTRLDNKIWSTLIMREQMNQPRRSIDNQCSLISTIKGTAAPWVLCTAITRWHALYTRSCDSLKQTFLTNPLPSYNFRANIGPWRHPQLTVYVFHKSLRTDALTISYAILCCCNNTRAVFGRHINNGCLFWNQRRRLESFFIISLKSKTF